MTGAGLRRCLGSCRVSGPKGFDNIASPGFTPGLAKIDVISPEGARDPEMRPESG